MKRLLKRTYFIKNIPGDHLRAKMRKTLATSRLTHRLNQFISVLAILSAAMYIVDVSIFFRVTRPQGPASDDDGPRYGAIGVTCAFYDSENEAGWADPNDTIDAEMLNRVFDVGELVIVSFNFVDFLLFFFVSDHKGAFLCSITSIVDLLSIVVLFFTWGQSANEAKCIEILQFPPQLWSARTIGDLYVAYIMRLLRTLRLLRLIKLQRLLEYLDSELQQKLLDICLGVLVTWIFVGGWLQIIERWKQEETYVNWLYFMMVMISTVGYGDIYPYTSGGRATVSLVILVAMVFVPRETNELLEMIMQSSKYQRAWYTPPKSKRAQHVIVSGNMSSCSEIELFTELFHEDHDAQDLHAVVLQPEPPSFGMETLLRHPHYAERITYLEGSPFQEHDLKRARVTSAVAIFMLTNKFCDNPDAEDSKTILQQFSIQRYVDKISAETEANGIAVTSVPFFCTQLIRPENRRHLMSGQDKTPLDAATAEEKKAAATPPKEHPPRVLCFNELKMGMLAKSCLCPGTNAFIFNLISSFREEDLVHREEFGVSTWTAEYRKGLAWELYKTKLPRGIEGRDFHWVVKTMYQRRGVLLYALSVQKKHTDGEGGGEQLILLNPKGNIPSMDKFHVEGFVIAMDKLDADLSSEVR